MSTRNRPPTKLFWFTIFSCCLVGLLFGLPSSWNWIESRIRPLLNSFVAVSEPTKVMPDSLRRILDIHGIDFLDNTQSDWMESNKRPGALYTFHQATESPVLGYIEYFPSHDPVPRSFELNVYTEPTSDGIHFSSYEARFLEEDFFLRLVSHNREYMEILVRRFEPYIHSFTVQDISPDWAGIDSP